MSDFDRIRTAKEVSFQDRRKKADWIVKMATILNLVSWAVAVAVWFVLESASPEREMRFVTSLLQVHFDSDIIVRNRWDMTLLPIAFFLLIASLCICIASFMFNKMRMRRKTDKYRKSIIIIGIITILGIIGFLIRFGLPF